MLLPLCGIVAVMLVSIEVFEELCLLGPGACCRFLTVSGWGAEVDGAIVCDPSRGTETADEAGCELRGGPIIGRGGTIEPSRVGVAARAAGAKGNLTTGLVGSTKEPPREDAADPAADTAGGVSVGLSGLSGLAEDSRFMAEPALEVGSCSSDADRRTGVASLDGARAVFAAPARRLCARADDGTGFAKACAGGVA